MNTIGLPHISRERARGLRCSRDEELLATDACRFFPFGKTIGLSTVTCTMAKRTDRLPAHVVKMLSGSPVWRVPACCFAAPKVESCKGIGRLCGATQQLHYLCLVGGSSINGPVGPKMVSSFV